MITPVVVGVLSTRRSLADCPESPNSRCPVPRTSGWIRTLYSSIRSWAISVRIRSPPEHDQILTQAGLELCGGLARVPAQQRGVFPGERFGQGPRRNVLLRTVEDLGERVRLRGLRPERRKLLVGAPPREPRAARGHALGGASPHAPVGVAAPPPAVPER